MPKYNNHRKTDFIQKGFNMDVCKCLDKQIEQLPKPLFRFVCHCETCRKYTKAECFDESSFLLKDCGDLDLSNIEFKSYQTGFSPMERGKCKTCGMVSFSKIRVWPFPAFVMLPSHKISIENLPKPFAHLYYKSRVTEANDHIKKVNGHMMSQLTIQFNIMKGLIVRIFK